MPPPTNWTKKPRPNSPKTMDGTPARLFTAMRTMRVAKRRRSGVLVQVDGGRHAGGQRGDGHQDDQGHGAEDGGEDAPGGHAVGRRLGEKPSVSRGAPFLTTSIRMTSRITSTSSVASPVASHSTMSPAWGQRDGRSEEVFH
jgi:hypothetical protein